MKAPRVPFLAMALLVASVALGAPVKHNYDLKNVLWKLSFKFDEGFISGDATNTLTLTEDTSTVELNCSDLKVSRVTVNGADARFDTGGDKLTVTLPNPGKAGDTLDVRTLYSGNPVNGLYFVAASRAFPAKTPMMYTQGEGEDNHYWLPTYDLPDDKATTECYITVPGNWQALSNGRLVDVKAEGQNKVFHWKMDQPYSTYLIAFTAGEYAEHTDYWHHIPVSYYVPPGLEKEGELSFSDTPKMIDLYSKLTGVDYPYAKYAQAAVGDFMFGGMENVTCTTQTIKTLHEASSEPVADSTYLVAHELAHHWFGDMVTCRTWDHMWLNEGFATTLPCFYDRATRGEEAFDLDRYRNFEQAIDSIGSRGRKDVEGDIGSLEKVNIGSVYDGGCSRILMLMHLLGEKTFWKGIHAYLEKYKFQPATTADFTAAMSESTGTDIAGFMKTWFFSPATPELNVGVFYNKLQIAQSSPYYKLDLPLWILDGDTWIKKTVTVDGRLTEVDLGSLTGKPFLVDPEVWTLSEIKYDHKFTGRQVYDLYRNAPNAACKARIISQLFSSIPVTDRITIAHTETYPGLLAMMASHMGAEGEDYLTELSHNSDERVVNAACIALGAIPASDETARTRLLQIMEDDKCEPVRERAMQALLNGSKDFRYVQMAWTLPAFDDGFRVMALRWWQSHLPDEARSRSLEVLGGNSPEPLRVAAIQVLGQVGEKPGSHDVFNALAPITQETSIGERSAAVVALGRLGNKDAISVLEPIAQHAPGRIMGEARDSLKKLGATAG